MNASVLNASVLARISAGNFFAKSFIKNVGFASDMREFALAHSGHCRSAHEIINNSKEIIEWIKKKL